MSDNSQAPPGKSSETGSVAEWAAQLTDGDIDVSRAAGRAMWKIVRQAGRPQAEAQRRDVVRQLLSILGDKPAPIVYRQVLWMLSEIGGDESVETISSLLANPVAREDASMALERIPGDRSLAALRAALKAVPDDFKPNIAQSLRARGIQVDGFPSEKLRPDKPARAKSL